MDNLEELVVSGAEMNRNLVAEVLSPFARLDKDNATMLPHDGWPQLKVDQKVLVYLVSRKAMSALEFPLDEEAAGAKTVAQDAGLPSGTANPSLRRLLGNRVVAQTSEKKYYVPNHAMPRVRTMILGTE